MFAPKDWWLTTDGTTPAVVGDTNGRLWKFWYDFWTDEWLWGLWREECVVELETLTQLSLRANSLRSPVSSLIPKRILCDDGMSDEFVVEELNDGDDEWEEGVGDGITEWCVVWGVVPVIDDGVEDIDEDVDSCDERTDDSLSLADGTCCWGCGSHSKDFSNNWFSSQIISEKVFSK